jgi:rhamnulokinase
MATRVFAAVDLGASSGRVIAGVVEDGRVRLEVFHRFPNAALRSGGRLRWNISGLYEQVQHGLGELFERYPQTESIGIDTWGVDYGLLDAHGKLLAEPISHRDSRTEAVIDRVHQRVTPAELFATNGLQFLPFTTLYQLAAEQDSDLWSRAKHAVLIPDLISYWLTGTLSTEITNASTTGLLDVHTGTWSDELLGRLNISRGLLPPLDGPGTKRGTSEWGAPVITVGSHDTASAVVGVPAQDTSFAYVISGTWSLVGLELPAPVQSDNARAANFTNEAGVDGTVRFLRNVGGLWLLQECFRDWNVTGQDDLIAAAALLPPGGPLIDIDDPSFIAPGRMPDRIRAATSPSLGRAAIVRCILDSLARAYVATIQQATRLSGATVDVIHVVGGGSQNELLCQRTADLSGLPVVAGPVEATALGNVLVQARTCGATGPTLSDLRSMIDTRELRRYEPS